MKIEYECNEYVAEMLVKNIDVIFAADATKDENYDIDDIWFSARTSTNYKAYPLENKTLKGGYKFHEDGEWRTYFTCEIYDKLKFGYDVATGTPVYFINKQKFEKLVENQACLSFLAPDGILIFSPKSLKKAFKGYADYFVRHTTDFGKKETRTWEPKAVLDLTKGLWIPCNPPDKFFKKS